MTSESPSAGPTNSGGAAATPAGQPPFDVSVAHVARVYDYWLGGTDNFPADRAAGGQAIAAYPDIVLSVRANRAFLARAIGYLATEAGIRQFLDIGTGIPTANNTHEVAQAAAPDSRVVYVDKDPVVLAHARSLLSSTPEGATRYLDADLRDTGRILAEKVTFRGRAEVARFFDGLDLVEPGMVRVQDWRPRTEAEATSPAALWCGVGRKL